MLLATGVIVLVLIAALAAPVSVRYHAAFAHRVRAEIDVHMFYGLVRTRARFPKPVSESAHEEPTGASASPRSDAPQSAFGSGKSLIAIIRNKPFRQRITRFLVDLWRTVDARAIRLRMRVGLGDPADTGRLWAIAGPVSGYFAQLPRASVIIEPEFFDAVFEFDSSGRIRFTPLVVMFRVAALACSPTVWRGMRQLRSAST